MHYSDHQKNGRLLIIDDNPAIHEDIRKILGPPAEPSQTFHASKARLFDAPLAQFEQAGYEIDSAYQGKEGLDQVRHAHETGRPYALVFVDVRMPPGWDGIETISRLWQITPELQVILCTAYSDYSWKEMIQRLGKSDNLVILKKPFDTIEVLQLAHALTEKWSLNHHLHTRLRELDLAVGRRTAELQAANEQLKREIAERQQMEKALRHSEERFSKAFKASPIPLAIQSLCEETFVDANPSFYQLTGFTPAELLGHTAQEFHLWTEPVESCALLEHFSQHKSVRNLPRRLRTKAGQFRETLLSVELLELDGEKLLLLLAQDVTEQHTLENQLRQVQKMEAVGQLAAGVAHDFNNILTGIQGHTSLLLVQKSLDNTDRKTLKTIAAAGDRAGKLVRQLLTFSRKQFAKMALLHLGDTLANIADMLHSVLPENIVLTINHPPTLPQINADGGMMELMIMNLAVNARDAMPAGGKLTISAELVEISPAQLSPNRGARPGRFLCLSVSDTGCGMNPDILSHIFEPFFTTKPVGKGTGLGLATVYGIVKQHDAWLEVQSQPGQGSCFRIFLPAFDLQTKSDPVTPLLETLKGGSETILVVEDETAVREFVVEVLSSHGYQTLVAASGPQALERWDQYEGKIHLLLTDMVMPGGLTGWDVSAHLTAKDPTLKVIYSSGYSPGLDKQDLSLLRGETFLPKPYGVGELLGKLRKCLDSTPTN